MRSITIVASGGPVIVEGADGETVEVPSGKGVSLRGGAPGEIITPPKIRPPLKVAWDEKVSRFLLSEGQRSGRPGGRGRLEVEGATKARVHVHDFDELAKVAEAQGLDLYVLLKRGD